MFANFKHKVQDKIDKVTKKHQHSDKKDEKTDGPYAEMEEEKPEPGTAIPGEHKQHQGLEDGKSVKVIDGVSVHEADSAEKQKKPSAMSKLKQGITKFEDKASHVYHQLGTKVDEAKADVKQAFQKVDQSIKNAIINKKKHLNQWIARKADQKVMKTMGKMQPKITKSLQDNKMPKCLQTFVADMTQKLWTDLTDLVRFELRVKMQEPTIELSRQPDKYKCLCLWYKFRNWYLYSVHPYDRSIWEQIKDPSYIFLKICQAITVFGIQASAFFLLFLAIDKTEEYQLINFILGFKTMQFFTAGILTAMLGYFEYFYCATVLPVEQARSDYMKQNSRVLAETSYNPLEVLNLNYCFQDGPGTANNLTIGFVAFFVQIILIWVAFFCLSKSRSSVDFIEEELKVKKETRGGRLIHFMIYDLIIFVSSVVMTLIIYYEVYYIPGEAFKLYQQVNGLFFFAKLIYGILSFPFLIFALDFFVQVFTTAKPTAYDTFGNVVPAASKIKLVYSEQLIEDHEEIDIEEALEHDKSIVV